MIKHKVLFMITIFPLLSSCSNSVINNTTKPTANSSSISSEILNDMSSVPIKEMRIMNINQYLSFAPSRVKVYYDKMISDDFDLYFDIIDPTICEIIDNMVIGKKLGTTTVYASDADGNEDEFQVRIEDPQQYVFYRDVLTIRENYRIKGYMKDTTLFIGDSFFDQRNFWKTFDEDFAGKNCFAAGISSSKATDWIKFRNLIIDYINPKNIVVHIGTNDINDNSLNYSESEYYEMIIEFLECLVRENPSTAIYYFGIENRSADGYRVKNIYCQQVTQRINAEFAKVYDNFHYIDSPTVFNANQSKYISLDGIHPSIEGYKYYVDQLNEIVDY